MVRVLARGANGIVIKQDQEYLNAACGACLQTVHFTGNGGTWGCSNCGASYEGPDMWGFSSVRLFWDGDNVILRGLFEWVAEWLDVPAGDVEIGVDL